MSTAFLLPYARVTAPSTISAISVSLQAHVDPRATRRNSCTHEDGSNSLRKIQASQEGKLHARCSKNQT